MPIMFAKLWDQYQMLDWILIIIIFVISYVLQKYILPHCRPFLLTDPTISYPMHPNTFPNYSLYLMLILSLVFYAVFVIYLTKPLQRLFRQSRPNYSTVISDDVAVINAPNTAIETLDPVRCDRNNGSPSSVTHVQATPKTNNTQSTGPLLIWIKGQLIASVLQFFISALVKLYAGRLRPDFIDRIGKCHVTISDSDKLNPSVYQKQVCEASRTCSTLRDGYLSFPSGHSSTSFSVFTFMSLFLFCHLRPFGNRGSFVRLLIALSPMSVAFICAVSRTRDNRHGFADILGGSVLGVMCAFLGFRLCIREVDDENTNVYYARSVEGPRMRQLYRRLQFCLASNDADSVESSAVTTNVNPIEAVRRSNNNTVRDLSISERSTIRRSIDNSIDYGSPHSLRHETPVNMNCDTNCSLSENTASARTSTSMRDRNLMQRPEAVWWI